LSDSPSTASQHVAENQKIDSLASISPSGSCCCPEKWLQDVYRKRKRKKFTIHMLEREGEARSELEERKKVKKFNSLLWLCGRKVSPRPRPSLSTLFGEI
jgi:hypothetical protein